jgi:hypothetical protein
MLRQCRICLESNNPDTLISPCACRGTAMYIHTRCLEDHLRYYPDGLCTVCRQPMTYTTPKEYIAFGFMFLCVFGLLVISNMDFLAKLFTLVIFASILVGLLLRHCILQEFGLVLITCIVALLGATTRDQRLFMTFSVIMIFFATFATLIHYIPQTYVMMFLAILFLGLYVLVFMAAVSVAVDVYGTSVILTTILLFWYTWIRLHPPLRQIQD